MLTRLLAALLLAPGALHANVALAADGEATPAELVTIGAIDGESDSKMSIINIRLDRNPGWSRVGELQDHGSFLQLVIPNALVPEPGKFYDGNNPHLPKIAVFQLTPSDAAVRLFVNRDATRIKQASQAEILGNRIVLTVDHARLASGLAAAETQAAKPFVGPPVPEELRPKPTLSADEIIAKTEVRHDIPAPAGALKGVAASTGLSTLTTGGGVDLREKLVHVAAFSGVMLLVLIGLWVAKPILRRRAAKRGDAEPVISMKTIASLPLAARQKVSLIQIGDEKFLIGVTPDAVTFLTSIGANARPSPFAAAAAGIGGLTAPTAAAAYQRQLPFARALEEESTPSVDLRPAPVLKNIEGNDEETLRSGFTPARPAAAAKKAAPAVRAPVGEDEPVRRRPAKAESDSPRRRINLSIGEDGIKNLASRPAPRAKNDGGEDDGDSQKAIDDVTRLIREKLKTLRTI